MCKCLYEAAKRMEENGYEDVEPPIELLSGKAYLSFTGTKKGEKKQQGIPLLLSKCPIFGEKYEKITLPERNEKKFMTNADWIRGLSNAELAEFLDDAETAGYNDSSITPKDSHGYPIDMLTWLEMERDGNETDLCRQIKAKRYRRNNGQQYGEDGYDIHENAEQLIKQGVEVAIEIVKEGGVNE